VKEALTVLKVYKKAAMATVLLQAPPVDEDVPWSQVNHGSG